MDDDFEVIHSPLCQDLTRDGKTIRVEIYEDGEGRWILEAIDEYGNSTVWDHHFETDQEALDHLHLTIEEEGMDSLVSPPSEPSEMPELDAGLSDDELHELEAFLMSEATSDETMMIDTLDGFLTAIVSGPVAVMPSQWLPKVWGPSSRDEPAFDNLEQASRIIGLIMRHMNGIIASLQYDPDAFEPLFSMVHYPDDPHEYLDGEMWAYGYWTGVELQRKDWTAFFDHPDSAEVIRPLELLGSDDLPSEDWVHTDSSDKRERLAEKIPSSVSWIYRFWLPYRQAMVERYLADTYRREHPKVGRNDPCPCGSGKKFKKCCGLGQLLH